MLVSLVESNPQADRTVVPTASNSTDENGERAIAMAHVHLPKLEDHGFVDWDRETSTVTRGPKFEEIEPLLTVLIEHEDDSSGDVSKN